MLKFLFGDRASRRVLLAAAAAMTLAVTAGCGGGGGGGGGAPPPPPAPNVSGTVVDATNNQPINGATVKLSTDQFGGSVKKTATTPTNANNPGSFAFTNVAAGTYWLVVSAPGYYTQAFGGPNGFTVTAGGNPIGPSPVPLTPSTGNPPPPPPPPAPVPWP